MDDRRCHDLFLHYNGGRYRKLFDAKVIHMPLARTEMLLRGMHSDDQRMVLIGVEDGRPVVLDRSAYVGSECTVYVSMTYGIVWVRAKDEFDGDVSIEGKDVKRFVSVPTFEERYRED